MKLQAHKIRHAIRITVLLGTASGAALANQSPTLVSGPRTPMCYCHCEHGAGAKQCAKMCELPQYEKRWWATSCHKRGSFTKESASRDSNSHSRKSNRNEEAHR